VYHTTLCSLSAFGIGYSTIYDLPSWVFGTSEGKRDDGGFCGPDGESSCLSKRLHELEEVFLLETFQSEVRMMSQLKFIKGKRTILLSEIYCITAFAIDQIITTLSSASPAM
jgi:hypothetical protein